MIFTMFDRQALYDIMQNASYIKRPTDETPNNQTSNPEFDFGGYGASQPYYSDQIPPFDVTLVGVNEFGNATVMKIFGVHLISEGTGISVDDTVQETQMTFVASLETIAGSRKTAPNRGTRSWEPRGVSLTAFAVA